MKSNSYVIRSCRKFSEQRSSHDLQQMEEGIIFGDIGMPLQRFRFPKYGRQKKQNLNDRIDDLRDIPKSRRDHSNRQTCKRTIQDNQEQPNDRKKRNRSGPYPEIDENTEVNYKIVREDNQLSPARAKYVD